LCVRNPDMSRSGVEHVQQTSLKTGMVTGYVWFGT
jgi:hypothetical protein